MRVLVAGGAGFIGTEMCCRLAGEGHEVVCVDNLVTGSSYNVDELGRIDGVTFVRADVCAPLPVDGPFDQVINLACPASPVDFHHLSLEILDVGSTGVKHLLDLARDHGARYLQASTSEVYGEALVHPQPETYWGNVNPVGPRSAYDEAKRFGEALMTAHHNRYGTDVRHARIFNTYGPRMRPDDGRIVSTFVTQALRGLPLTVHGDGTQTRSFCFVEDEVSGLLAVLRSDYVGPVNVGNDNESSVLEVAELVLELTGSPSGIAFVARLEDDPTHRRPDLSVVRDRIGWQPSTPFREGLGRTVEWFRRHLSV